MPKGPRLAVLTNAGGPGVMATDALVASGGTLARLSDATLAELDAGPAAALVAPQSRGRPRRRQVEARGQGGPDRAPGSRRRRPARHRHARRP
ncbi:MAG: hypothetical protein MZW92_62080 [Comamonadaceae bacterium]|nr:hypothetical protein [Comamonadaceae bacterium]